MVISLSLPISFPKHIVRRRFDVDHNYLKGNVLSHYLLNKKYNNLIDIFRYFMGFWWTRKHCKFHLI